MTHPPDPDSEEFRKMRAKLEQHQLEIVQFQRDLYDMFGILDKDMLTRVKNLLSVLTHADNARETAMYWRGWAEHELAARFDEHPVKSMVDDDELRDLLDS